MLCGVCVPGMCSIRTLVCFFPWQTVLMLLYCADAGNRKQSSDIDLLYLCLFASIRHVLRGGDSNVYCTSSRDCCQGRIEKEGM